MRDSVTVDRQLHHFVTEHLRTAILDGQLESGEWLRQQGTPSISSYSSLSHGFPQAIDTASHRDCLLRALDQIWSAFPTMILGYLAQTTAQEPAERQAQDLEEHGAILSTLKRRDGQLAEQLMRRHIEPDCAELLSVLDCMLTHGGGHRAENPAWG